jgi:AcrR family transcriptional regulator
LRERHKLATRKAISEAALRLAVDRGLDNLLIEDIADEAGVSLRTFRNYFANKYEAICAPARDRAVRIGTALGNRPASEPLWEAITMAVLDHYPSAEAGAHPESAAVHQLVTRSPALHGEYLKVQYAMQRVLAEAIAEREGLDVDQDLLPVVVAGSVVAAAQAAIRRWADGGRSASLQDLLRLALNQLPAVVAGSGRVSGGL